MCGICGSITFAKRQPDHLFVKPMVKSLQHRGPDDQGVWHENFTQGRVYLGHTRLSIIDLSKAGHQPMGDQSKNYWVTFNGEIYNYREIKTELTKQGYHFQTKTDTEVILAAYKIYGTDCLQLFNGMFAFALWDRKQERLFCARDRMGIKPFYYTWVNGIFVFASEIKALLSSNKINREPETTTLYDYLSLGLMHHKENTFFKNIKLLPAANFLLLGNGEYELKQYWHLSLPTYQYRKELEIEKIYSLLNEAVRLRLRSDVPVGILLSGGLDSSTITTIAANHSKTQLEAFSLEFHDQNSNEFEHAKIVADHSKTSLRLLKPQGDGLWQEIDSLIRAQDAPTHAPEVYSNWCMIRSVAQCNIKVLLCGQGGDELFCGYNWYPKHFLISLLRNRKIITFIKEFFALPKNFPNTNTRKKSVLLALLIQSMLQRRIKIRLKPELNCMNDILLPSFHKRMWSRNFENIGLLDPPGLEEKMVNDLRVATVPHYLHYEDANSMAFSIEERVPMLDHNLVEWMHSLSVNWKLKNGMSKYALREAMRTILPDDIVNRKDKMGLSAPRDLWFRNELRSVIEDLFHQDCFIYDKLINRSVFLTQLQAYMTGKPIPLSRVLWRIINIEKWLRIYFN